MISATGHILCKTLMDQLPSTPRLALALAQALAGQVGEIDADVIQIDEANITGHPDEGEWAAAAINIVLDAATKAKEKGVHLCFGNYGGQSIQQGEWRKLIGFINRLRCDHILLEFASRLRRTQLFQRRLDPRIASSRRD